MSPQLSPYFQRARAVNSTAQRAETIAQGMTENPHSILGYFYSVISLF